MQANIDSIQFDEKTGFFAVEIAGNSLYVTYECYLEKDLRTGQVVSADLLLALQDEDFRNRAFHVGLRYVSYCRRTEGELLDRLRKEKLPASVSLDVVERLKRLGFLDDRAYALEYAQDKSNLNLWGPRHIKEMLRMKGVRQEWIDEAIAQITEEDEQKALDAFLDKKYRRLDLNDKKMEARAVRGCLSKGFSYQLVKPAIETRKRAANREDEEATDDRAWDKETWDE